MVIRHYKAGLNFLYRWTTLTTNLTESSKKIKKCLGKNHWTITCMRNLSDFLYDCFGDFSIMNLSKLLVFLL